MDAFTAAKKTPGPKGLGGIEMRQRKLRDDHLAEVLSPFLVRCKRCQREIKLSAKSQYDPHHWTTHRKRCAKPARSDGVAVTKRAAAGKPKQTSLQKPSHSLSAGRNISTRSQVIATPIGGMPSTGPTHASAPQRISSQTPPLTPDLAAGSISDTESMSIPPSPSDSQRSFSPSTSNRMSPLPAPVDSATLSYLQRCHGGVSLNFVCSQEEWNWDRLRLPSFWVDSQQLRPAV